MLASQRHHPYRPRDPRSASSADGFRQVNRRLMASSDAGELLSMYDESTTNTVNLCTLAQQLSRARRGVHGVLDDPRYERFLDRVVREADAGTLTPRVMHTLVCALPKIGRSPGTRRAMRAIAAAARNRARHFDINQLANVVNGLVDAGVETEILLWFERSIAHNVSALDARGLATAARAYAGVRPPTVLRALAPEVRQRLAKLCARDLGALSHAYAQAQVPFPELLAAAAARVREMDEISIGMTASALGRADEASGLEAACDAWCESVARTKDSQNLSLVAWAVTRTRAFAPGLLDAIEARLCCDGFRGFEMEHIARCVWALACSERTPDVGVFRAAAEETLARAAHDDDLGILVWSFAKVRVMSRPMFAFAARHARHARRPTTVARVLWACSTCGCDIADVGALAVPEMVDDFSPRELGMVAWATAVLGVARHKAFARRVCARYAAWWRVDQAPPTDEQLLSLGQLLLSARAEGVRVPEMPAELLRAIERASTTQLCPRTSGNQRRLSDSLRAAGWAHAEEVLVEGILLVDMACVANREVVEYDGPYHDVVDVHTGEVTVTGTTAWKSRVLRALGWRVVRYPWRGPDGANGLDEAAAQVILAQLR